MKIKKFLARNYGKSWVFLKKSKNYIYISLGFFVFFILLGAFFPVPEEIKQALLDRLKEIVASFEGLGFFGTTIKIFLNNLSIGFFSIVLGVLLGIFPFLTAISNGYLLGFASKITAESQGLLVLWRLIPHGIFELPAIIISTGIGIKLGISVLKNWNKFKFEFTEALRFFVFVLLPLFLIAAIIEGLLIFFI